MNLPFATLYSSALEHLLPEAAILAVTASLLPLTMAWRRTRDLALRPAMAWALLAATFGLVAQFACFLELTEAGRPAAGHWAYLSSLATLAALISVFGARKPGGGAWAILMGMLIVVFLIPWLEGSGLSGGSHGLDRLRLDPPWAIFFALLATAGVTNYLPTRFGPAAILVGLALAAEWVGLLPNVLAPHPRAYLWSIGPLLNGLAVLAAWGISTKTRPDRSPFDRLWLWFRDGWGVVWALRVRERFTRAAQSSAWPMQLSWDGLISSDGSPVKDIPEDAIRTLSSLLKRFAEAECLEPAIRGDRGRTCPTPARGG